MNRRLLSGNEAIALGDRVLVMPGLAGPFTEEIHCPFPRPRDVVALRQDPQYQRIVVHVTRLLADELRRMPGAAVLA